MLRPLVEDREINNMKSLLRKQQYRRERTVIKLCDIQGVNSFNELDLNDPENQDLINTFFELDESIIELDWTIEELESIRDNTYDRFVAKKKVWTFLNKLGDKESMNYLMSIHQSSTMLVETVMENPNFIEETYEVKE